MRHRYLTADVFTDRPFGGNPLAVFPEARGISDQRMQQVARELNLSETVFVLPPEDPRHTRKLRIFTPGTELPFAGHPTVGTAFVLAAIGEIPLAGAEDPDRLRGGGRAGAGADPAEGRQAGVLRSSRRRSSPRSGRRPLRSRIWRRCSPSTRRTCWTAKTLRRRSPAASPSSTFRCATATPSAAPAFAWIAGSRSSPASGPPRSTSSPAIPSCPAPTSARGCSRRAWGSSRTRRPAPPPPPSAAISPPAPRSATAPCAG